MTKILTTLEKTEFYNKVYEIPEFAGNLTEYERLEVLKYSEGIIKICEAHTYRLFNETPQLIEMLAPKALKEGYKKEELWDYILNNDPQFIKAITVIQILNRKHINSNKPLRELKVNQIALIHAYEGIQITRENADGIAAGYGYISKNSGEGLFQDYEFYCSPLNRKIKPNLCTPKKLKNKITLFESIIEHLTDKAKQRAIDEINMLKTIYETEYQ